MSNTDVVILAISINGTREAKAVAGWPGELKLTLLSRGSALDSANVAKIQVRDPEGRQVEWAWRSVKPARDMLWLGTLQKTSFVWLLEPSFTDSIRPGSYEITIEVEDSGDTASAKLEVLPPSADLSEQERLRCFVRYDRARGDFAEAIGRLDAWLAAHPHDHRMQALRAELIEESGRSLDAVRAWSVAALAARQAPSGEYSKAELRRDFLAREVLGK